MATASTNFHKTDVDTAKESGEAKYDAFQKAIQDNQQKFQNQSAPTSTAASVGPAAQVATGPQDQVRADQLGLTQQLQAQANGTGPSLAAQQLRTGTDRTLAQQAALAAGSPAAASNPALAARNLQTQAVTANQALARDVAQQRMAEQINAQNQLGGVLSGVRAQDLGLGTTNAQLAQQAQLQDAAQRQQTALANQQAGLTTNGQNLQGALGFTNAEGGAINSAVAGQQFVGNQAIQQDQWLQQQEAAQAAANAAGINGMIGAGIGAAGSIATGGLSGLLPKK